MNLSRAQADFIKNNPPVKDVENHGPPYKLDGRQARLWNYFNKQDVFYPIRRWPSWVAGIQLSPKKRRNDRYRLFLFYVYNGLPSWLAVEFITLFDYRQKMFYFNALSKKHEKHLKEMADSFHKGELLLKMSSIMNMEFGFKSTHSLDMERERTFFVNKKK